MVDFTRMWGGNQEHVVYADTTWRLMSVLDVKMTHPALKKIVIFKKKTPRNSIVSSGGIKFAASVYVLSNERKRVAMPAGFSDEFINACYFLNDIRDAIHPLQTSNPERHGQLVNLIDEQVLKYLNHLKHIKIEDIKKWLPQTDEQQKPAIQSAEKIMGKIKVILEAPETNHQDIHYALSSLFTINVRDNTFTNTLWNDFSQETKNIIKRDEVNQVLKQKTMSEKEKEFVTSIIETQPDMIDEHSLLGNLCRILQKENISSEHKDIVRSIIKSNPGFLNEKHNNKFPIVHLLENEFLTGDDLCYYRENEKNLFETLLYNTKNVNEITNESGENLIHMLFKKPVFLNWINKANPSMFHYEERHLGILRDLIDKQVDIHQTDNSGVGPLGLLYNRHISSLTPVKNVDRGSFNVGHQTGERRAFRMICTTVLNMKPSLDLQTMTEGNEPLFYKLYFESKIFPSDKSKEYLLSSSLSDFINKYDDENPPLHRAVRHMISNLSAFSEVHLNVTNLITLANADVNRKDSSGDTAVDVFMKNILVFFQKTDQRLSMNRVESGYVEKIKTNFLQELQHLQKFGFKVDSQGRTITFHLKKLQQHLKNDTNLDGRDKKKYKSVINSILKSRSIPTYTKSDTVETQQNYNKQTVTGKNKTFFSEGCSFGYATFDKSCDLSCSSFAWDADIKGANLFFAIPDKYDYSIFGGNDQDSVFRFLARVDTANGLNTHLIKNHELSNICKGLHDDAWMRLEKKRSGKFPIDEIQKITASFAILGKIAAIEESVGNAIYTQQCLDEIHTIIMTAFERGLCSRKIMGGSGRFGTAIMMFMTEYNKLSPNNRLIGPINTAKTVQSTDSTPQQNEEQLMGEISTSVESETSKAQSVTGGEKIYEHPANISASTKKDSFFKKFLNRVVHSSVPLEEGSENTKEKSNGPTHRS